MWCGGVKSTTLNLLGMHNFIFRATLEKQISIQDDILIYHLITRARYMDRKTVTTESLNYIETT